MDPAFANTGETTLTIRDAMNEPPGTPAVYEASSCPSVHYCTIGELRGRRRDCGVESLAPGTAIRVDTPARATARP